MGSVLSDSRKPVKGGIFIQTAKTGFISGETISGVLFVNLEEQFPGHILFVSLEGIEETHYSYQVRMSQSAINTHKKHHSAGSSYKTVHAHGLNRFLDFSIPVYDFAMGSNQKNFVLSPGQWQIPFTLQTANLLPSSLIYSTNQSNCQLKYRLNAFIIPSDSSVRPVQGIQDIFIAQQMNLLPTQQVKTQELKLNTFCCFGSESLTLSGSTDKPTYCPGETAVVLIDCDLTKYSKTIKSFSVELNGILTMKSQDHHKPKVINMHLARKEFLVSNKQVKERVELPIPFGMSLTSMGTLVQLDYYLQIKPAVDGCCLSDDGSVNTDQASSFPIIINPTSTTMNMIQMPQSLTVEKPQNWNPAQLQPTNFSPQQTAQIQQQQAQFAQLQLSLMQQSYNSANGNIPVAGGQKQGLNSNVQLLSFF